MTAKIGKWGNSAAVRIPAATLEAAGLALGDRVDFAPRAGVVEVRGRKRIATIEELFAEAEKKYGKLEPPELVDWGPDRGAEIIDDEYSRGEITLEDLLKEEDASRRR